MSEAVSTINGKDFAPYWNEQYAAIASGLWLPTETALRALDGNSSNTLSDRAVANSWFSIKTWEAPKTSLPKTCFTSYTSFPVACTGVESIRLVKSKKIRIYPTAPQRSLLRNWFGVSRKVYNATVEYLRQKGTVANWMEIKKWLIPSMPEYCAEVPRAVRDGAVMDAALAVKAAKAKFQATGQFNEVKFRSRKDRCQTLFIRNDAIRKGTVYPRYLGQLTFSESLPDNPCDSRILLEGGRWFMCVPHEVTMPLLARTKPYLAAGVDPGVRTFLSFYTNGAVGELGTGSLARIARLCHYLDDLMARLDPKRKEGRVHAAKRRRMRKAADRLRWKIKDLIREVHFKCAKFLCDNFQVIFLPKFETKKMVSKSSRKLRTKSVRALLTWSHHLFRQRLLWMARKYQTQVLEVCEAYTSKTCNWTGEVNHKLGGAKVVKGSDGQVMARDHNGALGIYLKGFVGYDLANASIL